MTYIYSTKVGTPSTHVIDDEKDSVEVIHELSKKVHWSASWKLGQLAVSL